MTPNPRPPVRTRSGIPTTADAGGWSRRNRWIVMVLILLLGAAVVVWDFLRPARANATRPGGTPPPASQTR